MLVKRVVFALQKYGFCRAKRWFLHCKKVVFVLPTINIRGITTVLALYEHYVTANRSPRNWQTVRSRMGGFIVPAYMNVPQNGNPSAMFWQTVRSRRGRFIVPAYTKTPTKWQSVSNVLANRQQP